MCKFSTISAAWKIFSGSDGEREKKQDAQSFLDRLGIGVARYTKNFVVIFPFTLFEEVLGLN